MTPPDPADPANSGPDYQPELPDPVPDVEVDEAAWEAYDEYLASAGGAT